MVLLLSKKEASGRDEDIYQLCVTAGLISSSYRINFLISLQKDDGEKQSLKEKMQAMQEITLKVQMGLGMLAHILESIGNAFNFSVPFLSWLLFTVVGIVTVLLYYVPLRWAKYQSIKS